MGQLTSPKGCPICSGANGGKWTCAPCTRDVNQMRNMLRILQEWRSGYEANEISDIIPDPLGREWSLWDIERFYGYRFRLPRRMMLTIELFLYQNRFERDTARLMGVRETNPVGMYGTVGLTRLLAQARRGELPGCCFEYEVDMRPVLALAAEPVRYQRGKQPRCQTPGCNHSLSFHGRERGLCRVSGCQCPGWTAELAEVA